MSWSQAGLRGLLASVSSSVCQVTGPRRLPAWPRPTNHRYKFLGSLPGSWNSVTSAVLLLLSAGMGQPKGQALHLGSQICQKTKSVRGTPALRKPSRVSHGSQCLLTSATGVGGDVSGVAWNGHPGRVMLQAGGEGAAGTSQCCYQWSGEAGVGGGGAVLLHVGGVENGLCWSQW